MLPISGQEHLCPCSYISWKLDDDEYYCLYYYDDDNVGGESGDADDDEWCLLFSFQANFQSRRMPRILCSIEQPRTLD